MKFQKKPVVIEAAQWFKNGDHPQDYAKPVHDPVAEPPRDYSPEHQRENDWEGQVVRRFRHPDVPGQKACQHCGKTMHVHGWIDTLEGGHNVCPGDWIITGVKGENYPCKPDIFEMTYEPVRDES
jgi:hypothetical protein